MVTRFLQLSVPHWNRKLDLDPENRMLAASARRTFCTVGDRYTARGEGEGRAWGAVGGPHERDPPPLPQAVPPLLPNQGEHIVETSWEDPERDAEIGRKFNLWSAGCRETRIPASDPARHPVHG